MGSAAAAKGANDGVWYPPVAYRYDQAAFVSRQPNAMCMRLHDGYVCRWWQIRSTGRAYCRSGAIAQKMRVLSWRRYLRRALTSGRLISWWLLLILRSI